MLLSVHRSIKRARKKGDRTLKLITYLKQNFLFSVSMFQLGEVLKAIWLHGAGCPLQVLPLRSGIPLSFESLLFICILVRKFLRESPWGFLQGCFISPPPFRR